MARHLTLPQSAYKDVRLLLQLDAEKLRILGEMFGTSQSLAPRSNDFIQEISRRTDLDRVTAETVSVVCQYLLTVVESGHAPRDILRDVRDFVSETAPKEDANLVADLDSKSPLLEELLTPKKARRRAQKVEFLSQGLHPVAESFRSVCELRPVFEGPNNKESIVGFVPVVLLTVSVTSPSSDLQPLLLQMTPDALRDLEEVIHRTRKKLETIRERFGNELIEN